MGMSTDWEAMADREPDELLSSQGIPEVSKLSLEDTGVKVQAPKRRGRGTFSYKKNELYSDWQDDKFIVEDADDDDDSRLSSERKTELIHCNPPPPPAPGLFFFESSIFLAQMLIFLHI